MTAPVERRPSLLAPLADLEVRRLAAARFAALLGSSLLPTALAFGILALPHTSASSLGTVIAASVAGQVLALLPGGVVADRYPRRVIMVVAETVAGLSSLAMGLVLMSGNASILLLGVFASLGGVASGFFYPAFSGFIPEVAAPGGLQSVNSLLRLSVNVARILGTALSGLLVALAGPGIAITASSMFGLLAALLVSRVRPRFDPVQRTGSTPLSDFRGGWAEFIARRWVVAVVVVGAISNFGVVAALGVLGPLRASQALSGATSWALIATGMAIGTVLGAVAAVRIRPSRPFFVAMPALAVFALPIVALAVSTSIAVIVCAAFVAGFFLDVFSVMWDTALQEHVSNEALSRVSSFDWLASFGLSPIALALVGPMVDSFGLSPVLWIAAALALTPPLALLEPQVRRLRALGT